MRVIESPIELAPCHGCAFVPTMGALHEGHATLLRRAKATGLPVALSIFVNPTQFGPAEDLAKYPRSVDADLEIARHEGVDFTFIPAVPTIYPEGIVAAHALAGQAPLPLVATAPGLEDRCRPGHFAGVQLVVARLFDMIQPSIAFFGEKDWQQLKLVEAMVRIAHTTAPTRWPGLSIAGIETIREHDGLALSSRNRYLESENRASALRIIRAIKHCSAAATPAAAEELMRESLTTNEFTIDYAVVRDSETLIPIERFNRSARALVAIRLSWSGGFVRLIDNAAVGNS